MTRRRPAFLLLGLLLAASFVAIRMASPPPPGPSGPPLAPCPSSPNCVCSQDPDPGHRIAPLAFTGSPAQAMARLRSLIASLPRARILVEQDAFLRVEFRTRIFGFVDDVEFRMSAEEQVIHVRSASRVGYSDLGTNRRRVEGIREAFGRLPP